MTDTVPAKPKTYRFPATTSLTTVMRKLREERDWSQSHLASVTTHPIKDYDGNEIVVSYDHSYVSRVESGTRRPSREFIDALAISFQLTEDDPDYDSLYLAAGYAPTGKTFPLDVNMIVYKLSRRMEEIAPDERAAIEKTLSLILKGIS